MKPHQRHQRGAKPTTGAIHTRRPQPRTSAPPPMLDLWEVTYRDDYDAQHTLTCRALDQECAIAELWRQHPDYGFVAARKVPESAAQAAPLHSPPEAAPGHAEGHSTIDNALTLAESRRAQSRSGPAGVPPRARRKP